MSSLRIEVPEGVKESEIHALQFAICELMTQLSNIFFPVFKKWEVSQSLDLEVISAKTEGGKEGNIALAVQIRPRNWPECSCVSAIFEKNVSGDWTPYDGAVLAPHIDGFPDTSIPFKGFHIRSTLNIEGSHFYASPQEERDFAERALAFRQALHTA